MKPPFVGHYFATTIKLEVYLSSQTLEALRLGHFWNCGCSGGKAGSSALMSLIQFIIPTESSRIIRSQAAFSTGKESNPATILGFVAATNSSSESDWNFIEAPYVHQADNLVWNVIQKPGAPGPPGCLLRRLISLVGLRHCSLTLPFETLQSETLTVDQCRSMSIIDHIESFGWRESGHHTQERCTGAVWPRRWSALVLYPQGVSCDFILNNSQSWLI